MTGLCRASPAAASAGAKAAPHPASPASGGGGFWQLSTQVPINDRWYETRGGREAEQREREALRELLSRRRAGEFVPAEEMDARLKRMTAGKKRSVVVRS